MDKNLSQLKQSLLKGFNTYNNNSVLSHVLMPEGFAVSLGIKFHNTGHVLREALIGRFGEWDEQIHPASRTYDGGYTELKLSCHGHEMPVQSAADGDSLCLLVTPVASGPAPATLLISAAMLWNRPGQTINRGDHLECILSDKNIAVHTDGQLIREMNTGIDVPYLAVRLDRPVAVSTNRAIGHGEAHMIMQAAKTDMDERSKTYGDLQEAAGAMRACMAWDTIYEPENDQVCSPVSRLWNINWGGYVLFCWDTYFSAMLAMPENRELAYANLIAITHEKTEGGFVPNFGSSNDGKSRDRSQPPVGAMALREVYRKYREAWIVEYLFDDLLTWNRWWASHRRLKNGQLCWGSNPVDNPIRTGRNWETQGVNERLGAALESGLDNSPMYDDIPFNKETHLLELADVGLTGLYIMDCEALAELADAIGRPQAAELRERAEFSKDGLELLWDEGIGMYCNMRTDTGEFSRRLSPTNFYALYSSRVSDSRAKRMMDEHFYNPDEFYGEHMMPSIARNDSGYPDHEYWRGRIWAPMNFLAYCAMRKKGLYDACKVLAQKSEELLLREWRLHGHVHENYSAETGMGCGINSSDKFYHWGALLSLVALIDKGYVDAPEAAL